METSHHLGVRELDLSNWHANAMADKLNQAVPAIKSSAAFLSFLRANLVLDPSAVSHTNTPVMQPVSPERPRSTLSQPTISPALDDIDDIPDLSLEVLSDPNDKVEALALVADSVREQRRDAALSILLHPLNLVALAGTLAVVYRQAQPSRQDLGMAFTAFATSAFVTAYLAVIRHITTPYARFASSLSLGFLHRDPDPIRPSSSHSTSSNVSSSTSSPTYVSSAWNSFLDDREDLVLATRFGDQIVSALILRLEPKQPYNVPLSGFSPSGPPAGGTKRRSKGSSGNAGPLRGGKGVIRAWTTARPWRGQGVGADLLHEAVRVTRERCGREAEVGFAREHANSMMVLPETFNGWFRKRERRAALTLDRVAGEWELGRKRRY